MKLVWGSYILVTSCEIVSKHIFSQFCNLLKFSSQNFKICPIKREESFSVSTEADGRLIGVHIGRNTENPNPIPSKSIYWKPNPNEKSDQLPYTVISCDRDSCKGSILTSYVMGVIRN